MSKSLTRQELSAAITQVEQQAFQECQLQAAYIKLRHDYWQDIQSQIYLPLVTTLAIYLLIKKQHFNFIKTAFMSKIMSMLRH